MLDARMVEGLPHLDRLDEIGALTTLSPVTDLAALRRRLMIVGNWPWLGGPLMELSFIHFARWTVITTFPAPDGSGAPYPLNWPYLLFQASYDGSQAEYLDTFASVIPSRLMKVFGACYGFEDRVVQAPGADGRPLAPWAFRDFVDKNQVQVLDFRPRAPATVSAVRQALRMERTERRANRLTGAALDRAQRDVEALALSPPAATVGLREGVVEPLLRRVLRRRDVGTLTILAPLRSSGLDGLRALFGENDHPLDDFPPARFARLALLATTLTDVGQPYPDVIPAPYLVFSSDFDGDLRSFLDALARKRAVCEAVDAVFGLCEQFPGTNHPRATRDWVERHLRRPNYSVAGYAPRTAEDIEALVKARERVAERLDVGL